MTFGEHAAHDAVVRRFDGMARGAIAAGPLRGVPIGIQLAGRCGAEATLIRVSAQIEAVRPRGHERPPEANLRQVQE